MSRILVWFSCGAASACAAKLAIEEYGHNGVHVVYCDTMESEHPDNARFFEDVQRWIEHPIEKIRSTKYANIDEVFERERYMSGIKGARCTVEMKKVPRFEFQQPDDIHIFGLCSDEVPRIERFKKNNPELLLEWNLYDQQVTKNKCYRWLERAGIALPVLYSLGFKNNNCIGCVKATSPKYWDLVRKYFPEVFAKRARQSREIGVRLVRYHGERIFLDELPEKITDLRAQEDIECGPICLAAYPEQHELSL